MKTSDPSSDDLPQVKATNCPQLATVGVSPHHRLQLGVQGTGFVPVHESDEIANDLIVSGLRVVAFLVRWQDQREVPVLWQEDGLRGDVVVVP